MSAIQEELLTSAHAEESFMKYAVKDEASGGYYMGEDEFIEAVTPDNEDFHKIKRSQYGILFAVADRQNTGRVTLDDWASFQNLLARPDAEYKIAFHLFDVDRSGVVKFNEFLKMYNLNKKQKGLPFDWNSEWVSLYIGRNNKRQDMTYSQFSQMLRGLQGERIRQAFLHFDKNGEGFIEPDQFQYLILETSRHKLSDHLLENMHTLCKMSPGDGKISYATVRALQNIMREIDSLELILRNAMHKSPDGKITKKDFLNEAAETTHFSLFTPMEADVLFHFASINVPSTRLGLQDFAKVLDASWQSARTLGSKDNIMPQSMATRFLGGILESVHHFSLGSMAGAFGAFMVYPIDLVKTRMQNQRSERVGLMLYNNSFDCAKKVMRNEGPLGLYSGVLPQLVGVAPEKAIKLTVNDLVRGHLKDQKTGNIWWGWEILAGGSAGGCQVIFTNPLEIVKIRLQVQGEISKNMEGIPKRSALWIVKNLGILGLFKGASACLLRDIPFSAIYFPTYSHLKRDYFGESPSKKLGIFQLLTAGAIAGIPAAYLTTPFDVIKTRLQVDARKGETQYSGLRHCAATIWKREGFKAFFKGGPARIFRSSPQFGFTLAGYEVLQTFLPMPGQHQENLMKEREEPSIGLQAAKIPLPYLRSKNALKIILDLDGDFGKPRIPRGKNWEGIPGFGGKMTKTVV